MRKGAIQSVQAKTVFGLAILLVAGVVAFHQLSVLSDTAIDGMASLGEQEVGATGALGAARVALVNKMRIVNRLVAEIDRETMEAFAGESDRRDVVFRREMARVKATLGDKVPQIADIERQYEALVPFANEVIDARIGGATVGGSIDFAERFRKLSREAETLDRQMGDAIVAVSAALRSDSRALVATIDREIRKTVALGGVGMLIGFLLSLAVIRYSVARPLRQLAAIAQGILGGDRGLEVPGRRRKDEIGDVAAAVQQLKETLAANDDLARETWNSADKVAAASNDAVLAVSQVSRGSRHQLDSVAEITRDVSLTSSTIGAISDLTTTARDRTGGAVAKAEHAQRQMVTLIEAVRGISTVSEQINQITQRIAALATRSNILSLNAAIEAARAGEHGRGFGVVASEVNLLSVQTSDLAQEIADLATSSSETIRQGVEMAGGVRETMSEVVGVVEETGNLTVEVARAIEEQRTIIKMIDDRVLALREVSNANAVASEHIAAAMADLAELADATRQRAGRSGAEGAGPSAAVRA